MFKLFSKTCYLCKKKSLSKNMRNYFSDDGKKIVVCQSCVPYAERRALRKR